MSGYETPRPEDEVTSDFEAEDLRDDDRPIDPAAAKAHDVQPDDEKPVLDPDPAVDPYEEANP